MLRLLLAEIRLLQFESSENPEDIDRAATLFGQVPSTYPVQPQHETYLNELRARMYKARWEFFRTKKDLAASLWAYDTMSQAISKCSAGPSWLITYFQLGFADLLRMYRQKDDCLSKSYLLANTACREARKRASEWQLSSISRMEAQAQFIMGETLQEGYVRYRAFQLLDNAISAYRQSVLMTDLKDANFSRRAFKLSSVLRKRAQADQTNQYQCQADLYEARHWAGKIIWSRMPLRRWQRVSCVLELGHLLWDCGAPIDRVIPLYQRAVELDTKHFASRVESWQSLARAMILRGCNTKFIGDLDSARACLYKVRMLEREKNDVATGRLPVAASLKSTYYQLTVSDILP